MIANTLLNSIFWNNWMMIHYGPSSLAFAAYLLGLHSPFKITGPRDMRFDITVEYEE